MSRTFRKKTRAGWRDDLSWVLRDWGDISPSRVMIDPKSKEGRKRLAKYHSDKTNNCKEPGPSWFRNLTTERPQRREAKNQLHRYAQGEEFEVILNPMDPLDYWT